MVYLEHEKNLKLPFRTPDYPWIPAHRQCPTQSNPECLEHGLALVVVVLPGEHDVSRDAGPGAQAVEEMLERYLQVYCRSFCCQRYQ